MKVLIDTNIWLDVILKRSGHSFYSRGVIGVCLMEEIEPQIAATSLKDVFYLTSKIKNTSIAYKGVETILQLAQIIAIDKVVCEQGVDLEKPDYEDGLIAAAALLNNTDAIVTRDGKGFKDLPIEKYSPEEFILSQGYEEIDF